LYQRYDLDPAAIPALLDVAGESSSGRAMRFSFAKFCTLLHTAARFRALPPPLPPGRGNVIIVAGDSVSRDMALAWRCSAAAGKGRALVEFPAFAMLAYRALEGKLMGEALECAPANVEQCFFSIDNAHAGPIRCCNTLKEALDAAEMKGLRREDVGAVLAGYGAHYHVGADANASETMMRSHMQGIFRTLDEYCQGGRLCLAAVREPTAQHFQTDVGDFVASATEAIRAADDVQRPCRCKKALDGERLERSAGGRLAAIIREVGEQYVGRVAVVPFHKATARLGRLHRRIASVKLAPQGRGRNLHRCFERAAEAWLDGHNNSIIDKNCLHVDIACDCTHWCFHPTFYATASAAVSNAWRSITGGT